MLECDSENEATGGTRVHAAVHRNSYVLVTHAQMHPHKFRCAAAYLLACPRPPLTYAAGGRNVKIFMGFVNRAALREVILRAHTPGTLNTHFLCTGMKKHVLSV